MIERKRKTCSLCFLRRMTTKWVLGINLCARCINECDKARALDYINGIKHTSDRTLWFWYHTNKDYIKRMEELADRAFQKSHGL